MIVVLDDYTVFNYMGTFLKNSLFHQEIICSE